MSTNVRLWSHHRIPPWSSVSESADGSSTARVVYLSARRIYVLTITNCDTGSVRHTTAGSLHGVASILGCQVSEVTLGRSFTVAS